MTQKTPYTVTVLPSPVWSTVFFPGFFSYLYHSPLITSVCSSFVRRAITHFSPTNVPALACSTGWSVSLSSSSHSELLRAELVIVTQLETDHDCYSTFEEAPDFLEDPVVLCCLCLIEQILYLTRKNPDALFERGKTDWKKMLTDTNCCPPRPYLFFFFGGGYFFVGLEEGLCVREDHFPTAFVIARSARPDRLWS